MLLQGNAEVGQEQRVHEELQRIAKQRSALDAQELALLREAKALRIWRNHGYATLLEYLETELGYAPRTVYERIRVAEALEDLPAIESALASNALKFSAVRELTRVASRRNEHLWIDHVANMNLRQIEEAVQGLAYGDDPATPKNAALRRHRLAYDDVLPETLALERQARLAANTEAGRNLDDQEFLTTVLRTFLTGTTAPGEPPRPAYQLAITTCRDCKRSWQNGAGREFQISPSLVERASCDAQFLGDLDAETPARITASVTPRMRAQVFARDGYRCTNPTCRSTRNLRIHHIRHQEHGGKHVLSNLTTLCDGCHTLHHDNLLAIAGTAPDHVEFERTPLPTASDPAHSPDDIELVNPNNDEPHAYERLLGALSGLLAAPMAHVGTP